MSIKELKQQARGHLKHYYWMAVVVCLAAQLLGAGGGVGLQFNNGWNGRNRYETQTSSDIHASLDIHASGDGQALEDDGEEILFYDQEDQIIGEQGEVVEPDQTDSSSNMSFWILAALLLGMGMIFGVAAAAVAVGIFISNVVRVGRCAYFLLSSKQDKSAGVGTLFLSFRSGWYLRTVANMFLMNLFIILWTLLLIIPGIIKGFEYAMIPYILGEEPQLTWTEAKERSKSYMDGKKMKLFLLQMSFLGWYLLLIALGVICIMLIGPGTGAFLVGLIPAAFSLLIMPYQFAAEAEFYKDVKQQDAGYEPLGAENWN